MATDTGGNVQVDFVWGNMPMQPDDDRSEPLDPALDSHVIASANWNGFPAYTPVAPYLDTVVNVSVPDVVDNPAVDAQSALEGSGLVYAVASSTWVGATTANDGYVRSQNPVAETMVNDGSTVSVTLYAAPTVPNVVGLDESAAEAALVAAHLVLGAVTTADNVGGATAENDGLVKTQDPAAAAKADSGSAVDIIKYEYTAPVVPGAPTNLVATPGVLSVSIAFTAPVSDGGSAITDYEYTLNDGVAWSSGSITASPLVLDPIPAVETTVKIRAVNAVGAGAASAAVTFTPSSE